MLLVAAALEPLVRPRELELEPREVVERLVLALAVRKLLEQEPELVVGLVPVLE